jgi:hypothetical protein
MTSRMLMMMVVMRVVVADWHVVRKTKETETNYFEAESVQFAETAKRLSKGQGERERERERERAIEIAQS